jgi:hypothetical protein
MTIEIKSLYSRGESCSVYRDETVESFSFQYDKGGCPITQDAFNALDFQATRGGVWKKEVNYIDGTLSEEIKLMPTLSLPSLPPPPKRPAQLPRRDYGFLVNLIYSQRLQNAMAHDCRWLALAFVANDQGKCCIRSFLRP